MYSLLKKICPNCQKEYGSLELSKCKKCGCEVYLYLSEDKGFSKLKSAFSSNKEAERELVADLESLVKWKDFFENIENPNENLLDLARKFKNDIPNHKFPEMIVIENEDYKYYLRNFHRGCDLVRGLDEFAEEIRELELSREGVLKILNNDEITDEAKRDYLNIISTRLDEIADNGYYDIIQGYDGTLAAKTNELNEVMEFIRDCNFQLDKINDLKEHFIDFKRYFDGFSKRPSNHDSFKKEIFSLSNLDVLPYFDLDSMDSIGEVKNIRSIFSAIGREQEKVNNLNSQIDLFNEKFDNLVYGIVDDYTKHKFLEENTEFRKELSRFDYFDLLDDTDKIKDTIDFFNNYDDEWDELAMRKADLDRKESFKNDFRDFNEKWKDFNDFDDFNRLADFNSDYNEFAENYSDLMVENQFEGYLDVFNRIEEVRARIASLDFANFKVSILLNFLKDSSISPSSKIERLNSYREMLDGLNSMDLKSLEAFDSSFKVPYSDIEAIGNLFNEVNKEIERLGDLKSTIDEYNEESKLPEDINGFKDRIDSFSHLEIIPYFDGDLKKYVETLIYLREALKQVEIEINKISTMILECSKCKLESEKVDGGKMSREDFLEKYSSLKSEISSFRYLDLWPSFDPNMKDFAELVREVRAILE